MKKSSKEVLETIVEIVKDIQAFNFDEHVKKVGLGFNARREDNDEWIIEFSQPDNKELQAFLFRFRLFIQRNEPISFYNLNSLFSDPHLSETWKSGVGKVIEVYNNYYNDYPVDIADLFGKRPTNGEILDTVIYGGLGHTGLNPKYQHKREKFQEWARDEIRASVLFQTFTRIILTVFRLILIIANLSEAELKDETRQKRDSG